MSVTDRERTIRNGVKALLDLVTTIPVSGTVTVTGVATETTLAALKTVAEAIRDRLPAALVGGKLSVTDPTALPLPSGAATESGNLAALAGKDFATQTTLASVLGQLDNKTSTLATHAKQDTQTVAINAHRTLLRKTLAVAGVVDGGEVEITDLTASTPYEVRCLRSTPATTGGAATHRQRSLYEATGGAAVDLAYQEAAALAIADGVSIPLRPGPIAVSDAAGKLWLRYSVTGAGDITETVVLDLLPMLAG